MTRAWQHNAICPYCGGEVPISTPFSLWLRRLPYPYTSAVYDNQNLDYIWHCYGHDWFITMEEKRYGGKSSFAQEDTHGMIAQMLAYASGQATVLTKRGYTRRKEYRGHYVITFEQTTPDDSKWILINGIKTNKQGLMALLHTGRVLEAD